MLWLYKVHSHDEKLSAGTNIGRIPLGVAGLAGDGQWRAVGAYDVDREADDEYRILTYCGRLYRYRSWRSMTF